MSIFDNIEQEMLEKEKEESEIALSNEINKNNQFDDNLSDVSISILDVKEEDRKGLELDQLMRVYLLSEEIT